MTSPLEKFILEKLECPSCYNYMCPPINQCLKGHNVCHECFAKISSCPNCRSQKSESSRNYALEAIFERIKLTCRNDQLGCPYEGLGASMKRHQKYCGYAIKRCPFAQYSSCEWKDSLVYLHSHLVLDHPNNFYRKDKQKFISERFRKIKNYHHIIAVIYVHENFFRLTWEIEVATGMTRWAVYFMGSPEEARKYYYKLEFLKEHENNPINLTFKTICDAKPDKERRMFEDHNCFHLHKSLLDRYCDYKGDLHYKISIYSLEPKEDLFVSDLALLFNEEN